MTIPVIGIERISKSFVHGQQENIVLNGMSLEIQQGSFVVMVGPSGCGKSTLLNIVAGLLPASTGRVYYRDHLMVAPRLEIGYLTQKDTLMPWRSIKRNVELPLEIRGIGRAKRESIASELIGKVGLGAMKSFIHANFRAECSVAQAWHGCSALIPKPCSWTNPLLP